MQRLTSPLRVAQVVKNERTQAMLNQQSRISEKRRYEAAQFLIKQQVPPPRLRASVALLQG